MERIDDKFYLSGAREILAAWPDSGHLRELIETIEAALADKSDKALDGAKCLIESVCKTIMTERGEAFGRNDDVCKLVKNTLGELGISETECGDHIRDLCSGLLRAAEGVRNLRNAGGPLGHGKDVNHLALGDWHRIMTVQTAETIVVMFFEVFSGHPPDLRHTRKAFPDDEKDELLDLAMDISVDGDTNEVIFGETYRFRPSEILYTLDREAYINLKSGIITDAEGDSSNTIAEE